MSAGVLFVYDREIHLELEEGSAKPVVGDTFAAIRGNGPREGERMGTATVTAVERGVPELEVRLG